MYVELKTDNDGLVCSAALQEADKNGTKHKLSSHCLEVKHPY